MLYRFDNIQLDSQTFVLLRDGQVEHVEPLVFDLITFLLQNAGQVLTRDDVMAAVWKGRFVSDTTISSAIKSARQALGDDGEQQKSIRTVRGRGFQFVAELRAQDDDPRPEALAEPENTQAFRPSLIVLPFQLFGNPKEIGAVADSLAESLTTVLTRVPLLSLVSRSASFALKGQAVVPAVMMKELGATYMLEGSLQKFDDTIRANVQLIETTGGMHLWAQQFECRYSVNAATDLLHRILPSLEPQLLRAMYKDADQLSGEPSGRQLLLKAIAILSLKGWHKESFLESASLLRQSIKLEPNNALAHGHLALTLALGQRVGLLEDRKAVVQEAVFEAERGLDLDGMDSNVLGLAGCAFADVRQTDRAVPILKRAIELNPNNGQAQASLGSAELMMGNFDSAIKFLANGIRISPADGRIAVWGALLSLAYLQKGCFDMALDAAQLGTQHDEKNYLPKVAVSASHLALGEQEKAIAAMRQCYRVKPDLSEKEISSLVGRELGAVLSGLAKA